MEADVDGVEAAVRDDDGATSAEGTETFIEKDGRRFVDEEYIRRLLRDSDIPEEVRHKIGEGFQYRAGDDDSDSSVSDYCELEQPPIRKQLKKILQEYPDGSQILRELIQNAEDANANEVKILHDCRQYCIGEASKKRQWLKVFKTPALFVYNDEVFRNSDWKGIRRVYSSVKEEDSFKIGRFGLGFKSVFHMTDSPVIISGDKLLIINPMEDQFWKVCHTIKLRKIFNKRKYQKLREIINDVLGVREGNELFKLTDSDLQNGKFTGTLFWFPLRMTASVEDPISSNLYTANKVHDLFDGFHKEASLILLFLKHINSISLHQVMADTITTDLLSVHIESNTGTNIHDEREKISKHLQSCSKNQMVSKSLYSFYDAKVITKSKGQTDTQDWFISTFYQGTDDMSPELRRLLDDKDLKYQPYVGVACPGNRRGFNPHVFCFLPLPLQNEGQSLTNLPVHVNGSFALDSNRRHMKWPTSDNTENKDSSLRWNRLMVTEVLPNAYSHLVLEMIRKETDSMTVYRTLPDPDKVDTKWCIVLQPLLSKVLQEPLFFTSNNQVIRYEDAVFFLKTEQDVTSSRARSGRAFEVASVICGIVEKYCPNFVPLPDEFNHLRRIIADFAQCSPRQITPIFVEHLLKKDKDGMYKTFSTEEKLSLLVFLTCDDNFDRLFNLELLPVNCRKRGFRTFCLNSTETVYLATEDQRVILPGLEDVLLTLSQIHMPEAESVIQNLAVMGRFGVQQIEIENDLPGLLYKSLQAVTDRTEDEFTKETDSFMVKKEMVGDNWLKSLWEYTSRNISSLSKLENLPILPVNWREDENLKLKFLRGNYIGMRYGDMELPTGVISVLMTLRICVIKDVPIFVERSNVFGTYINFPSPDGAQKALLQLCGRKDIDPHEIARTVNENASADDRLAFGAYMAKLDTHCEKLQFLKHVKLFPATDNACSSIKELFSVDNLANISPVLSAPVPVTFPRKLLNPLPQTIPLAKRYRGIQMTEPELIEEILSVMVDVNQNTYNTEDVVIFMTFYLECHCTKGWARCTKLAKEVAFLYDDDKRLRPPEFFFSPLDQDLCELFYGETNRFPTHRNFGEELFKCLLILGLRTSNDVTVQNLVEVAHSFDQLASHDANVGQKSTMLVHFLLKNIKEISQWRNELLDLRWVPVVADKPKDYPESLPWHGEGVSVCSPEDVATIEFRNITGSSNYICSSDLHVIFEKISIIPDPKVDKVVEHWKNIVEYSILNKEVLCQIFEHLDKHLSSLNKSDVFTNMKDVPCVLINENFVLPRKIYLDKRHENVIKAEPYRFLLPEIYQRSQRVFERLGCCNHLTVSYLVDILHEVSINHEDCIYLEENEMEVVISVLKSILLLEPLQDELESIKLPAMKNEDETVFVSIQNCIFVEDAYLNTVNFPEPLKILDRRIPRKLAEAVGVKNLLDALIDSQFVRNIVTTFQEFNPTQEDIQTGTVDIYFMCNFIKTLVERGASRIRFHLDERQNLERRTSLLSSNLAPFQGPCLWIYHDADSVDIQDEPALFLSLASSLSVLSPQPCVLSKGSLTLLDLERRILPKDRTCETGSIGIEIEFSQRNDWVTETFADHFELYTEYLKMTGNCAGACHLKQMRGTVYRLPVIENTTLHQTPGADTGILQHLQDIFESLLDRVSNLHIFSSLEEIEVSRIINAQNRTTRITSLYRTKSRREPITVAEHGVCEIFEKTITVKVFKSSHPDNDSIEEDTTWIVSKRRPEENTLQTMDHKCAAVAMTADIKSHVREGHSRNISQESRLFTFFPTEETMFLPVHINGDFRVKKGHSYLQTDGVSRTWNRNIIEMAICSCYLHLLKTLQQFLLRDEKKYYSLWPKVSKNHDQKDVVSAFYRKIVDEDQQIFLQEGEALKLGECIFLDFELRFSEKIGNISFNCFTSNNEQPDKTNADIPRGIYNMFKEFNLETAFHVLTMEKFWQRTFFPSLQTRYWDDKKDERNELIVCALQHHSEYQLTTYLKTIKCIPSAPLGHLVCPKDLVHVRSGSPLDGLFDEEEGKFIENNDVFQTHSVISSLEDLGMLCKCLPDHILLERAESIRKLDHQQGNRRFKALVRYLKSLDTSNCLNARAILSDVEWVPVEIVKPKDYPQFLPWYGEKVSHCKLNEGHRYEHRYLVGSVDFILKDEEDFDFISQNRSPSVERVAGQLQAVVKRFEEKTYDSSFEFLLLKVYEFLANSQEKSGELLIMLKAKNVVWTYNKFVCPHEVCINFSFGIKPDALVPYMYCLEERLKLCGGERFFKQIGCHEELSVETLLSILKKIKDAHDKFHEVSKRPPSLDGDIDVVLTIVDKLADLRESLTDDNLQDILLPAKYKASWKLMKVSECVYTTDECQLIYTDSSEELGMNILHGKIAIETAERLGVQSLNRRLLQENNAEEMISDWGQSEPLTRRLQRLLEEYQDGFSIPKELLQNADDAGATELVFILDDRENAEWKSGLIDGGMAECQGAALWVYNDAQFEEEDFKNIIKLAGKSKCEKTSKIGKFGLGFCAVYNMTDVPSFVSGNSMVILDPHTTHLGKSIKDKSSPGIRIKFDSRSIQSLRRFKNQFMPFKGICGCDLSGEDGAPNFKGTLFRFPLRTRQQANSSEINDQPYRIKDLTQLLAQLVESGGNLLLFTQNVHTIRVEYISSSFDTVGSIELCKMTRKGLVPLEEQRFLTKIANMDSQYLGKHRQKTSYETEIRISVGSSAKRVLGVDEGEFTSNWFTAWSSGTEESIRVSQTLREQGAISVGGVAIAKEFSLSCDRSSSYSIPLGFYDKSHIFCFLPLPQQVGLPVHINGSFFLDHSRRSFLQGSGTDSRERHEEEHWNDVLLQDAVCLSYMELLEHLPRDYYLQDSNQSAYWRFWPIYGDSQMQPLVESFYRKVSSSMHRVFFTNEAKFTMKECIFLHASLRFDEDVGDIAFQCLQNFYKCSEHVVMDLSRGIHEQFKTAYVEEELPCISAEQFFTEVFLPNISNAYWNNKEKDRDRLLIHALLNVHDLDSPLAKALRETRCVPVRPDGVLVQPCDLIHESHDSRLLAMFCDEDHRFIQFERNERFRDHDVTQKLLLLGMMTKDLPDKLILERAQSIRTLSSKTQIERCRALVSYLKTIENSRLQSLAGEMADIEWVPVSFQRPDDYPFFLPWFGKDTQLSIPRKTYDRGYRLLLGSTALIHESYLNELFTEMNVEKEPEIDLVLQQLRVLVDSYADGRDDANAKILVDKIYNYLFSHMDEMNSSTFYMNEVKSMRLIWNGKTFVDAYRVFLTYPERVSPSALEPYRFRLPKDFEGLVSLFEYFGCQKELNFDCLLDIQNEIREKYRKAEESINPTEDMRVVMCIISDIAFIYKEERHQDLKKLMLPVITGKRQKFKLSPVKDCVYTTDDFFLENIDEESLQMQIMDRKIGIEVAEKLGVQSLSSKIMSDNDAEEMEISEWGQAEPLTTRIQGLIDDYKDGFAIPKELVQNADDAGANIIRFLYDERINENSRTGLLDEGMAECQGPAMWVYNNALFSEEDFSNIIKLAGKTKESERSKIGKFGLGFCSIYNLTDVPSFISGNSLVILDPHTTHLGKAIRNKSSPGIRLKFTERNLWLLKKLKNQFLPFQDIFECDLSEDNQRPPYFNGTLFRLPLRTAKQAENGKISNRAYSHNDMLHLLQKFSRSIGNLMLFTQNITNIEVYRLQKDGSPKSPEQLIEVSRRAISDTVEMNILNKICTRDPKSFNDRKELFDSLELEIMIQSKEASSTFLGMEVRSEKYRWYISHSMGGLSTVERASRMRERGAVPLGSVGISDKHIQGNFITSDKTLFGFHDNNRLFCFLPLPVSNIHLPVYVNGCFFVDKSRKCLHLASGEDNTRNDEEYEWNQVLMRDAVASAYLKMIDGIHMDYFGDNHKDEDLYKLWPTFSKGAELFHEMMVNFYQSLCHSSLGLTVFAKGSRKFELKDCIFLDFSLRYEDVLGDICYSLLYETKHDALNVMDMPRDIFQQFQTAGCEDRIPVYTTTHFFYEVFLPEVDSDFWFDKENERKKLILIALKHAMESDSKVLVNALRETACIPSRPHGRLRKPCDLIHESRESIIQSIFAETDERFVDAMFSDPDVLKYLVSLGMICHTLPEELLLERAQSIQNLPTPDEQLERCRALLNYLKESSLENDTLQDIQFLPVLHKPKEWPLCWCGSDSNGKDYFQDNTESMFVLLDSPIRLASQACMPLVGCVMPVLDEKSLGYTFSKVIRKIGVKSKDSLDKEMIKLQLEKVAEAKIEELNEEQSRCLKDICENVYAFLGKCVDITDGVDLTCFRDLPVVYVCSTMVAPRICVITLPADCKPEFYSIEKQWDLGNARLRSFFMHIGVRQLTNSEGERFLSKDDVIQVLKKYETHLGDKTDDCTALLIVNLLTVLKNLVENDKTQNCALTEDEIKRLFAPDSENVIRRPIDLCRDDKYEKLSDEPDLHIVHDKMTQGLLRFLKIKSKRSQFISRFPLGVPFGQKEKLTSRLRGILEDHPSEISVFKELLQNADDALATEVSFILDKRSHGTKYIFHESMKEIQGPALCVFNDSAFTDEDLTGICRLGDGSKRDDSLKTGQFGIGFNAVYNVTDVPSILTKGPETPNGGTLIIFDPHQRYIPETNEPGIRIPQLEIVENKYPDVFHAHLQEDEYFKAEKGTWLRLPLRNSEMAHTSEIKQGGEMTIYRISKLFSSLEKYAEKALLFLSSVRNIKFVVIETDGSSSENFIVSSSITDEEHRSLRDFRSDMKQKLDMLKSNENTNENVAVVKYNVKIETNKKENTLWRVVQNFSSPSNIPDQILKAFKNHQLRLSPRGGVAYQYESCDFEEKAAVFSFLPLSMDGTGLPVHVNGHFALHSSRTSICEDEEDKDITLQGQWNNFILQHVVPFSYVNLLIDLREIIKEDPKHTRLGHFYDVFPKYSKCKSEIGRKITRGLFQMLIDLETSILPITFSKENAPETIFKVSWITFFERESCPIFFNDILSDLEARELNRRRFHSPYQSDLSYSHRSEISKELRQKLEIKARQLSIIMKEVGMKLTDAPLSIRDSINASHCTVDGELYLSQTVSDQSVIQFFKTWSPAIDKKYFSKEDNVKLKDTVLKTPARVKLVLEYCFYNEETFEMITDMPLCVDELKQLEVFSKSNSVFVSSYSYLLPASRDAFIHNIMVPCLQNVMKKDKSGCLRQLSLESFAEYLPVSLTRHKFTMSPLHLKSDSEIIDKSWIQGFWKYLSETIRDKKAIGVCKDLLREWALLPSILPQTGETVLYSFQDGHAIIDTDSFIQSEGIDRSLADSLLSLALPRPFFQTNLQDSSKGFSQTTLHTLMKNFIVTSDRPVLVIRCLSYHKSRLLEIGSRERLRSSKLILQYLTMNTTGLQNSEIETRNLLRNIPMHATVDGNVTDLPCSMNVVQLVNIPDCMPKCGLSALAQATSTIFLLDRPSLRDIYQKILSIPLCNELEFYMQHLLPHIGNLTKDDRQEHLIYLRNKLKDGALKEQEKDALHETMKIVNFIPCANVECLMSACEFYSPHVRLFTLMCNKEELPPPPYNHKDWEHFMILSGMITCASKEKILKFVRQLEKNECTSKQNEQLHVSKCIVDHVFREKFADLRNSEFLEKLSKVRFLIPHQADIFFNEIYPQYNRNVLISFRESIYPTYEQISWTTCKILPEYANIRNILKYCRDEDVASIEKSLGLLELPGLEEVLAHTHNVCYQLGKEFLKEHETGYDVRQQKTRVRSLMENIYRFLDQKRKSQSDLDQMQRMLSETALIYSNEHKLFFPVDQVILKLDPRKEILPYLSSGPECYGKYFDLFRALGCSNDENAFHLSVVLKCFHDRAGSNNKVSHVELEHLRTTFQRLFMAIEYTGAEKHLEAVEQLYLLSEDDVLVRSNDLVFNDRESFRKRVSRQSSLRLSFLKLPNITDVESKLKKLPLRLRPMLLSQILREELHQKVECYPGRNLLRLKNLVNSPHFCESIVAVLKYQTSQEDELTDEEENKIRSRLVSLRIEAVSSLTTVLIHGESVVGSSQSERSFYWKRDNDDVTVFMKNSGPCSYQIWLNKEHIPKELLKVLKWCLYQRRFPLDFLKEVLLLDDPEDIIELTESHTNEKIASESWLPELGSSVPIYFHHLLDNRNYGQTMRFRPGEIAVYEMFDASIDSDDPDGDAEFVYVKIVKVISTDSDDEFFHEYRIFDGQIEKNVLSLRLYKIIRPPRDTGSELVVFSDGHRNLEIPDHDRNLIFREITKTLQRAWNRGRNDFKRIVKRLLLRWHPDKNSDERFYTEVTQFILDLVRRLENGETIFDEAENQTYGRWKESYHERDFTGYRYGRDSTSTFAFAANVHQSAGRRQRQYSSYGSSRCTYYTPNPQTGSARRWFRQAKYDLDSANREMDREKRTSVDAQVENAEDSARQTGEASEMPIYNWICYKAHQAAEKALKAVVMNSDANKLNNGRLHTSHDLVALANLTQNAELIVLSQAFRNVVSEHTRMRYPETFADGKIPSEVFEEEDANKALKIANSIIEQVEIMLG